MYTEKLNPKDLPLPNGWPKNVCRAVLFIASITHYAVIWTRSWCANSKIARVRLAGRLQQAETELAVEKQVNRINAIRWQKLPPQKRPQFPPEARMAILELRAAQGWTQAETARHFGVAEQTIGIWQARLNAGDNKLFSVSLPANVFPEFVKHVVQRVKRYCPTMGKVKIAQALARTGLHLAVNTVGRALKSPSKPPPDLLTGTKEQEENSVHVVTAKRPNHVWHVDMTQVPTTGLWTAWFPNVLPQVYPFVWHVAVVVDHYSRACMGFAVFKHPLTAEQMTAFLDRVIQQRGKPKYIISDQGTQFQREYKEWAKGNEIKPRFGKVGKHGSIAVVERFIRSLKDECTRVMRISYNLADFCRELELYVTWYNCYRPHTTLAGKTPIEVNESQLPANALARF